MPLPLNAETILAGGKAHRYGVGVGRDGFGWSGIVEVGRKAEWPTWTPPPEMIARDAKAAQYASGMPGGPDNLLGARALYLYQGGRDTIYRIMLSRPSSRIGREMKHSLPWRPANSIRC